MHTWPRGERAAEEFGYSCSRAWLWRGAELPPAHQVGLWNGFRQGVTHPEGRTSYYTLLHTQTGLCQLTGFYLQRFLLFFFQAANLQQVLLLDWQFPWIRKCQQPLIHLQQWSSDLLVIQFMLQLVNLWHNKDNSARALPGVQGKEDTAKGSSDYFLIFSWLTNTRSVWSFKLKLSC